MPKFRFHARHILFTMLDQESFLGHFRQLFFIVTVVSYKSLKENDTLLQKSRNQKLLRNDRMNIIWSYFN